MLRNDRHRVRFRMEADKEGVRIEADRKRGSEQRVKGKDSESEKRLLDRKSEQRLRGMKLESGWGAIDEESEQRLRGMESESG